MGYVSTWMGDRLSSGLAVGCSCSSMAVPCCFPASIALQDHVPVTVKKNSCYLLASSHLLTLHIISVVNSTFMLIFQLVMVINL